MSDGCPFGHYSGHAALAQTDAGLVLAFDGAMMRGGDQFVWVRRSDDWGWDPAVDVSDVGSGFGYLHPRGYGDYMEVAARGSTPNRDLSVVVLRREGRSRGRG